MLPIILVGPDSKKTSKFIGDFIVKYDFQKNNIFTYKKEKTVITIEQIRELESLFARRRGENRLIIIYDFETAKKEAQNALLKTLEERSAIAQFLLVARERSAILPTIISRSKTIKLKEDHLVTNWVFDEAQPLAVLMQGVSDIEKGSEKAVEFCDKLIAYFKRRLMKDKVTVIKEIIKVRNHIVKNNLNPQLAIDHLIIFIRRNLVG